MKVLITDDEKNIRESLKKYLGLENIEAEGARTAEEALGLLENESFDAVVLDLKLPGMSGQEALEHIRRRGLSVPVIMISAHGQIADAVAALKSGAQDYLVKPFDPAELIIRIQALVENRRRENVLEAEKRSAGAETAFIGESPAMKRLAEQIGKISGANVTVLITGESGSGKEVAAREIHARSPWKGEPFAAVNIGGIHEGLMESELFGHEKGSFTGAAARKIGLFELAGKGSIFLDEIGEMPMALQVKLLRVLQEKKVRRLGGGNDIPINARIISATNRDIEGFVKDGRFREDLYYRLNVFRLSLPPLRDRKEDIPLLAVYLLSRLAARMGRPKLILAQGALEMLGAYSFPGNVRELENILERAVIYSGGTVIGEEDIDLRKSPGVAPPVEAGGTAVGIPAQSTAARSLSMEDIERKAIGDALAQCGGNRSRAAELLGLSRKTVLNKLKAYGMTDNR
jgi:two-component system response regulator AtoC